MIKAEIVVDFPKWKTKIKDPSLYLKKKIKKLSCVKSFKKKKEFNIYCWRASWLEFGFRI